MRLTEQAKYLVYRTPGIRRLMAPTYPYKINPAQLATMVQLIDATRDSGALVAEVGVAQGDSSVFLLEHLRTCGDDRSLHLFDTFSGFTPESITVEVDERGKDEAEYDKFRYGSEKHFRQNLQRLGYQRFETHAGDASVIDWSAWGGVGAMLLDIDLYEPTRVILDAVYPHLVPGGGIVVDDCLANTAWDGSLQAYQEFIDKHDLPFIRVGEKGALVRAK
ncbi:MAG TPA: TylF/MycF/NovP-related O-methyltransferase [Aeromicrobium sp.]|nr:TylF/MycF/NovP-related O-methyltransferase [Aeromicrobium sp.]